jgi:hypothetical protein
MSRLIFAEAWNSDTRLLPMAVRRRGVVVQGECGSPVITTEPDDGTSTVPDGGDDDPEA